MEGRKEQKEKKKQSSDTFDHLNTWVKPSLKLVMYT